MTAIAADFDDILISRIFAVIAAVFIISADRTHTRIVRALVIFFCH